MKLILILALVVICCHKIFAVREPISPLYTVGTVKKNIDPKQYDTCYVDAPKCDPNYKYRSYNGSCNNLEHPTWGMTNTALLRLFEPRYGDGIELPPTASDGSDLPSARKIVTSFFPEKDAPDNVSLIVAHWAQFVAHDAGSNLDKEGAGDCCASDDRLFCLPIPIPDDDPFYAQYNRTCLSVTRAQTTDTGDCDSKKPKTPINGVTHNLDASQVYGSDEETASTVRQFEGGRLIMREKEDGRCFLPLKGTCYNSNVCYEAGDTRVNQNSPLSIMHTMLAREHNRVADKLADLHPDWNDETLYQEARSIVIAEYLHITYDEFVPNIIPEDQIVKHQLKSRAAGYHTYNPEIPHLLIASFANPGFRIFHSAIQGVMALLDYHLDVAKYINLTDYMNSPEITEENSNFDEFILGLITEPMQSLDNFYSSQIEDKLFHFDKPYGTDLVALDIQRPRDHGVPGYPTILYGCSGKEVNDFDDLADIWPADKIELVRLMYKSVDDIDLFVGVNFENKQEGHRLTPVLECLMGEQFYRWKNGDRFWYEIEDQPHSFTPEQLNEIRKTSLSRLICDNSDHIVNITTNVWIHPGDSNPLVPCDTIPSVDLSQWS